MPQADHTALRGPLGVRYGGEVVVRAGGPVWQLEPIAIARQVAGLVMPCDETGVYAPEGEWLESPDDDNGTWVVRRFSLERCTFIDGILSDNRFHPESPAWFARDIAGVASFIGVETDELIEWLCSEDVLERADAWRAIGDYHGFDNLDAYPLTLTRQEVEARYSDLLA